MADPSLCPTTKFYRMGAERTKPLRLGTRTVDAGWVLRAALASTSMSMTPSPFFSTNIFCDPQQKKQSVHSNLTLDSLFSIPPRNSQSFLLSFHPSLSDRLVSAFRNPSSLTLPSESLVTVFHSSSTIPPLSVPIRAARSVAT